MSIAASTSRGHSARGTCRLWPENIAIAASSKAPITPAPPRMVSGGSSLSRYFVTGQLNPQPTEVMARNINPAGVIARTRRRWF